MLKIHLFLFIAFSLSFCASREKFVKVDSPEPGMGRLFIYRPFRNVLVMSRYKILLYKYSGDFRNSHFGKPVTKYVMKNGTFVSLSLTPGYYRIEMPRFRNTFKIILVKAGETGYYNVVFYSKGRMGNADAFIKEETPEDAVFEMLRYGGLVRIYKPD